MLKIKINFSTYFCLLLFLLSGFKSNLVAISIVFIVHELGHIFFCMLFKVEILSIEIFPFGGLIKLDNLLNYSILKSFLISFGGLLFQLLFSYFNNVFINSSIINYYNWYLFLINFLPIIPLDGSRILQNVLSKFISFYNSYIVTFIISIITVILITLYNLNNPTIIIFFICFLIKEICSLNYIFNRFLLERYIYNFNFKKNKFYKKNNLKKLELNKQGFFFENIWKNEKEILSKKFDNCSYIW